MAGKSGVVLLTFRTTGTDKAAKEARTVGKSLDDSGGLASRGARGLGRFAGGLGDLVSKFLPFDTGLGSVSNGLDGFADKLENSQSKALGWKSAIAGVAAGVVVAAGLAAGGLFKAGEVFDDVTDTIRIGTGATGAELDSLTDVAKDVGNLVPAEFGKVGPAVADLNTRLGLTGDTLTTVAAQVLEAGRLLGEEVDVESASAAFSAFGIEGDAVSGSLDTLFRVSQATGVGMNELASGVQRQGVALKELGFGFDQSVALLGSLDKAGLNANSVLAGLTKGMVTLAKEGEEPAAAFERVTGEIGSFLETGDRAAAINLASKIFGTRGAAQFVGAVESGKLNLDALSAAAQGTGDSILDVSKDTADFAESWQLVKNNALTAIEPLGSAIFGLAGGAMGALATKTQELSPQISDALSGVVTWFSQLGETIGPLIAPVLELWSAFSPLSLVFQAIQPVLPQLMSLFSMLAQVLGGTLVTVLQSLASALTPVAEIVVGALSDALIAVMPVVVDIATLLADQLASALITVSPLLTMLADIVGQVLMVVAPLLSPIFELVSAFLPLIGVLLPIVGQLLPPLVDLLMAVLPPIMSLVTPILELAGGALGFLADILASVVSWISQAITWLVDLVTGSDTAAAQFQGAWEGVAGFFEGVFGAIGSFISDAFNNAVSAVKWAINSVIGLVNGAIDFLNGLKITIPDFIPGIGGQTWGLSIPKIPYLARGGDVEAGRPYVVGDAGYPELFVPESDGHVYPRVPMLSGGSADDIVASLDDAAVTVGPSSDGTRVIQLVMPDGRVLLETTLDEAEDAEARL